MRFDLRVLMEPDHWKQVGALDGALCINNPPGLGGMNQKL